jgi:hypothetical protein
MRICALVGLSLIGLGANALAGEPNAACAKLYGPGWKPVTGNDNADIASPPKPKKGVAFADPAYKTCVTRATDHKADGVPGFAREEYSRRQAFNADDSMILITATDGGWWVYDARTYQPIHALIGIAGDAESEWHPTNPDLLYYLPRNGSGMKLFEINVKTNVSRLVTDFAPRIKKLWPTAYAAWTHDYGSPSADGRYRALEVADEQWRGLGIFTYDVVADRILGTYSLPPGSPQPLPTMAPSGKYVLVTWGKEGGTTDRFTLDFKNRLRIAGKVEHSDVGIDANGDDTFLSVDYDSDGGPVYIVNVRTGKRTDLFRTYIAHSATAMHFSGKAFRRPGWFVLSTYHDGGGPKAWLHRKVMAVEMKANPRIVNLAHHHSVPNGYWTEPHATVNRDFTKVLFNSNWDINSDSDVDTYLIQIPRSTLDLAR